MSQHSCSSVPPKRDLTGRRAGAAHPVPRSAGDYTRTRRPTMRILLIEDSRKLLGSLRLGLSKLGDEVDTAADGETGIRMAERGSYDVVVLDLLLPGVHGLDVLRHLRAGGCDLPILILTALDAVEDRVAGLQAGADDYLAKPFSFDELVARLRALTRRKFGVKSPVIQVGDLAIDTARRTVHRGSDPVALTSREYRLLEYLAFRKDETVSCEEIEEHLYGARNLPLSNVVHSAVCSIRSKLREHGDAALIHTRPRLGYVLGEAVP